MNDAGDRFVERADQRIHWSSVGMGQPLVLLPGLGSGMRLFGTLPRRFARAGFRALTFDPVGIPPSSALRSPYRFTDAAEDVVAVLDDAGVDRVDLVGTSLGGKLALTFAARHPQRVGRLVLLASAAVVSPRARRVYRYFRTIAEHVPPDRFADAVAPFLFGRSFHGSRPQVVDDIARATRPSDSSRALMLAQLEALESVDLIAEAVAVTAPALCLAGAEDTLTCAEDVAASAALMQNARHAVIPHAGHSLLLEQPATFDAVLAFLREPLSGSTPPA